jgi:putative tryptophan/tyrosine transport system substrate-binding protein
MRRREFIASLGGAAMAWPVAARAQQQPRMPVIGILGSPRVESYASRLPSFMQGLKEIGFIEGQNVAIQSRWANDDYGRLPDLAADLVRAGVSLIVALGNNLTPRAAKNATATIPIVFVIGADPVQVGLVASLNKPGANVTGVTSLSGDQLQKRLQLLHDTVPTAKAFGLIINPDSFGSTSVEGRSPIDLAQTFLRVWGGTLHVAHAQTVGDFDAVFASLAQQRIDALVTSGDSLFLSAQERLVSLAARYAIPAIYYSPDFVKAGGLMSYSTNIADIYRKLAYTLAVFSKARSRPTCPCCCRRDSISSSTSRPPRLSGSPSPKRCSPSPTR